ncbi:MAG: MFS transporter [Euryarchaeota archaeon]|nr:MFS transporter [Euryarchaeota archaeon]
MASTPRSRAALVTFCALLVLGGLNFSDQGLVFPLNELIIREFRLTDTQMGLVGSAFIFVLGGVMIAWGYLADIYSRKKIMLFGAFLWSITAYALVYVQNYEQLFLVRALGGVGIGSFFPVAFSMSADMFPPGQRGKAAAWLNLLPAVGAFAGIAVAVVYGPTLGWRFPFQVIGLGGLVAVGVFWFLMKEPRRASSEPEFRERVAAGEAYGYKIRPSDWKVLYQVRANLFLLLQGIPGSLPWGILTFWTIPYLNRQGFPILLASLYLVGFGMGAALGNIVGGYLGDRLHRTRGIQWRVPLCLLGLLGGMVLMGAVLLRGIPRLTGFTGDPSEILPFSLYLLEHWEYGVPFDVFFIAGILATLTGANWFAIMQDINLPEIRGSVSGFNNVTNQVGAGIGPLLGGLLGDLLGLQQALFISTLFWVGCALLWLPLYWNLPEAEKRVRDILAQRARESGQKPASHRP